MMVQSTIDKIKDTTIYRSIRKLCGVIDEQNTVVENLQNELDAFDLDGVKADVTKLKTNDAAQDTKITTISENVATLDENVETNTEDITYLKSSVSSQNSRLTNAETDILNLRDEDKKLTNALPKTYTLYRNGEGKIQAQVETIDGTLFNSNTLDMIIPYQYDIISGTTERSFKLDITMSDGSKYTTNDFIIPAGGGTEIVVTGITLAKDTSNVNRFHVGINLSDGTMIDSGYISMVDNVVATYADSKLTISVNGVSSVPVAIETGSNYTAGTGITITSGTIAIDDTVVALKSVTDSLGIQINECATGISTNRSLINPCYNDASITNNILTFTCVNGSTKDITIPTGGGGTEKSVITITDMDTLLSTVKLGDILIVPLNYTAHTVYTDCGVYGRVFTPSPSPSDYYCVVNFVGIVTRIPEESVPNKYVTVSGYGRYYLNDGTTTNSENTIQELSIWRNISIDLFSVMIAQSKADAVQYVGYLDGINIKLIQ